MRAWNVANDLWILAFLRESLVSKANLSVKLTSSCSERSSSWQGFLLTATLVRLVKARMTSSYCFTVFSPSSVCFLCHSVALGTLRRNQSAESFFHGFFARAFLDFLHWKVFNDREGSREPDFCDGCDGCCDSGCCGSRESDPCRVFRFLEKDSSDERARGMIVTRLFDKSCKCSLKSGQRSQCWRRRLNRLFWTFTKSSSTVIFDKRWMSSARRCSAEVRDWYSRARYFKNFFLKKYDNNI